MSYPQIGANFLQDLLRRKEFYSLRTTASDNFRNKCNNSGFIKDIINLKTYQKFVRNFMSIHTKNMRVHLLHGTGVGKTLTAASVADERIVAYRKIYNNLATTQKTGRKSAIELDRLTPNVFVLGFAGTKVAFYRELLRYPQFGFVTLNERDELNRRWHNAAGGGFEDIKYYKEYHSMLKRRITNKARGGFYKFFGYDEFVNRLFSGIELIDIAAEHKLQNNGELVDLIHEYEKSGKLKIDRELLESFKNSLLICDEIHNTYNTDSKNNRGLAIQYILDTINPAFLSLSATPINNSPTECIEFINYLADKKLTKQSIFNGTRQLIPGKLEELRKVTMGKISFMQDSDVRYFPTRNICGEDIVLDNDVADFKSGQALPYLKFIQCPMSDLHQSTLNNYMQKENSARNFIADDDEIDEILHSDMADIANKVDDLAAIPLGGYMIFDMVMPGQGPYGLFMSNELRQLMSAPQQWLDSVGLIIRNTVHGNVYSGPFLLRENIGKYSSKYEKLINLLMEIICSANGDPNKCKKIMVYHNLVRGSGILLIREILIINGFLDEFGVPTDSTVCCLCGNIMADHGSKHGSNQISLHEFRPVRMVMAHSDVDKNTMNHSINVKFNAIDNSRGHNFMILLGSKIIKESYDLKDCRVLIGVSLSTNVPTELQVFGRCQRDGSHANLPPEDRNLDIYLLVSTISKTIPAINPISPEVRRYAEKLADYKVIQRIERELIRGAIDADMHLGITMSRSMLEKYFPANSAQPIDILGNLYFEPEYKLKNYENNDLINSTFDAFYGDEEINTIMSIIKRLFISRQVWTYDELLKSVHNPDFNMETNPKYFSDGNFAVALDNLVKLNDSYMINVGAKVNNQFGESLMNRDDKYIYISGNKHNVVQVGKYYIAFPVEETHNGPLNTFYSEYAENIRDKERLMIKEFKHQHEKIVVDVDLFMRERLPSNQIKISIGLLDEQNSKYEIFREKFLIDCSDNFLHEYPKSFQVDFLEEAILAASKGKTIKKHDQVIELLAKYDVVIFANEVRKYKDVVNRYKNFPEDNIVIGYVGPNSLRLLDSGEWLNISKLALNRHLPPRENPVIIGYFDFSNNEIKFKLRKPTNNNMPKDIRFIEHGIVCNTKNKTELIKIAQHLGTNNREINTAKVKNLCAIVRDRLLVLEAKERAKSSRIRYIYSWWDNIKDTRG